MKVQYFGYNCFLLSLGNNLIAIDPGGTFLYYFRMTTLIPESQWKDITHILITHGDPDHYWHSDRIAAASGAPIICNKTMLKDGKLLGPRSKGLQFDYSYANVHPLDVNESKDIEALHVTGLKTRHGSLLIKIGPFSKIICPGPAERVGWGSMGFVIEHDGVKIVNLGDALLDIDHWAKAKSADLLCIPIGGSAIGNTMDVDEALQAVESLQPKAAIPCHYNCKAFFTKNYNPADDQRFRNEVEKQGIACHILEPGEERDI